MIYSSFNPDCYVYVYLDPRKPGNFIYGKFSFKYEPFYIGKGRGKRSNIHIQLAFSGEKKFKSNKIRKIYQETKKLPIILIIKDKMTSFTSTELEKEMIKSIGRLDKKIGPLLNLTNGGDGTYGIVRSKQWRINKSNSLKGRKLSEDTKSKISKKLKGRKFTPLHLKNLHIAMLNRAPASLITRLKLSKSLQNRKCSEHEKEMKRKNRIGKKNSQQTREKIGIANKKRKGKVFKNVYEKLLPIINEAKRLLNETDLSIENIKTQCNFSSVSVFSSTFKKYVGVSPLNYRRKNVENKNLFFLNSRNLRRKYNFDNDA